MSNAITQEEIQALIDASTFTSAKVGRKTTVVTLTLPNGFEITESSACVDRDNYVHEIGEDVCRRRLVDRVWLLEGYRLQCELVGR